jgi:hypothetical protein
MAIPDTYRTMDDNFDTGYENITNKELMHMLKGIPRQSEQERIKAEMTRRLIDEIAEFNKKSSKHSKIIMWLTIALGILAVIQVIILLK